MNTNDINTGNEHPEIREQLRNLPRLRASDEFVKNLQLKIDIHNAEAGSMHARVNTRTDELQQSGYFKNIFGARWTMPAAGITVAAAIVFAIIFWNKGTDTAIQEKLSTTTPSEVIQEKTQPQTGNSEIQKKTEDNLKQDIASLDKTVSKDKPFESNSKVQVNSLKSKISDEVLPAPTLEIMVGTPEKKVSTNFTEEKSSTKTNQSDDANLRKLQMGNARGGDSKANSPSSPPKSIDTEQSGRLSDSQTNTKSAPVKKTVKDVNELSKTSLESIKAKVK